MDILEGISFGGVYVLGWVYFVFGSFSVCIFIVGRSYVCVVCGYGEGVVRGVYIFLEVDWRVLLLWSGR